MSRFQVRHYVIMEMWFSLCPRQPSHRSKWSQKEHQGCFWKVNDETPFELFCKVGIMGNIATHSSLAIRQWWWHLSRCRIIMENIRFIFCIYTCLVLPRFIRYLARIPQLAPAGSMYGYSAPRSSCHHCIGHLLQYIIPTNLTNCNTTFPQ